MFMVENIGYTCPVTDRWIASRRSHEDNLRRQGCRVLETGEKEAAAANRAKIEADFDAKIEATVEREVEALPSAKRETLYNEMTRQGLTAQVTRA